jgi:hypothetical protein
MLIRQFHGVVIIATKVAFASLPSPPFRSEPVGMTVRTHVAHDLNAIPMRLAVLVVVKVLVMVSLVSFWFWVANATLALAESGVCKP